jgi:hypothetical protein
MQSIESKSRAGQESQRMQFVMTKERQEVDRKRIEAQRIAGFQNNLAKGIGGQSLHWKGIEATEKFARSTNVKMIFIGAGKGELLLILDAKQGCCISYSEGFAGGGAFSVSRCVEFSTFLKKTENIGSISSRPSWIK